MSQGFFEKEERQELREWKRVRSLGWIIMCGYADPKDIPANQMEWWPMAGDEAPKPHRMTKSRQNKIAKRIKQELARGMNNE